MFVANFIEMLGLICIIVDTKQITIWYDLGFNILRIFSLVSLMLGYTLISQKTEVSLIGTVFGIASAGLCFSISMSQLVGGYLYDISRMAPFCFPLVMCGIFFILLIVWRKED